MHVDENFAQTPVFIFASVQINLVPADDGLLRVAFAAMRKFFAFLRAHPLHQFFDDAFGHNGCALGLRLGDEGFFFVFLVVDFQNLAGQRLAQLGAITIKRIGLQPQLP